MDLVSRVQNLPIGKFHYTLLCVVGLGWMFDAMDTGIIAFIMTTLVKDWALTPAESGWIVSIGFVGMAIGAVFWWIGRSFWTQDHFCLHVDAV